MRPEALFQECIDHYEPVSGANPMRRRAPQVAVHEVVGKLSFVVIPGNVALQSASDVPRSKAGGLIPPPPTVTPWRPNLDRLAALLDMARGFTLYTRADKIIDLARMNSGANAQIRR
jgi:pyruvate dehydrogenase (quinone)